MSETKWEGSPSFRRFFRNGLLMGEINREGKGWTASWVDERHLRLYCNGAVIDGKFTPLDQESAVELAESMGVHPLSNAKPSG